MNTKITIGITGGIGSGKSMVCRIISTLGYPIFYADQEAKALYFQENVRRAVEQLLGSEVYTEEGLNKPFLTQQIYTNPKLKKELEAIIHPAVRSQFQQWVEQQETKLVFAEAAILFETGSYQNYHHTILVTAPKELRISRVRKRDQLSREEVLKRMNNQWSDEKKANMADFIIDNDQEQLLVPQVIELLKKLDPS